MQTIGERILLTLWVGVLWGVGYLAVPVLFAELDDRMLAGRLAGEMFHLVSYIGLGAGALLLLAQLLRGGGRPGWRGWSLAAMVVLVGIGEFVLQPMMAELKAGGLAEGSGQASEFAMLHGISSTLYLIVSLAGLALVAVRPGSGGS